jgi:hypothetical protein
MEVRCALAGQLGSGRYESARGREVCRGDRSGKPGEECTNFKGNEGCESDLCLRVEPGDPEDGMKPRGVCSISCDPSAADPGCPDGPSPWHCTQVWPSEKGWFCTPTKTWVSAKATRNGQRVSSKGSKTADRSQKGAQQ